MTSQNEAIATHWKLGKTINEIAYILKLSKADVGRGISIMNLKPLKTLPNCVPVHVRHSIEDHQQRVRERDLCEL